MQFDIRQLQVFVAVAENLGFSRAAKILGMAQASVSERIAGLEKEVGTKLFDRLGRKVALTQAGELLLDRAKEIIATRDKAAMDLRTFLGMSGGDVHIGGSSAPGEYRLPALIASLKKSNPDIKIFLTISDSEEIIEKVERGSLEMGVAGRREPSDHLQFKKLWSDEIVLVVPPTHRWARRAKPLQPGELSSEPWVIREAGSATRGSYERSLGKAMGGEMPDLEIAAMLGSLEAVKAGVKAGLGIAALSLMTVRSEIDAGLLSSVRVDGISQERSFYLVRDGRRTPSPAAAVVWKHILSSAG